MTTVDPEVAGEKQAGARHRKRSRPRGAASVDMTPASAKFIIMGRIHSVTDRVSRTTLASHTRLRMSLPLSLPPQPPLNTSPRKTWAALGAPVFARSLFRSANVARLGVAPLGAVELPGREGCCPCRGLPGRPSRSPGARSTRRPAHACCSAS